jgi:hypothetical protein
MLFNAAAVAATANRRTRRTPSRTRVQSRTPTPSAGPRTTATVSTPVTAEIPLPSYSMEALPIEAVHVLAAAKHRSDMGRPNLHIGLHYAQAIEDHGTDNNVAVWVGETKHKSSKSYITHTNQLNAERDLLRHEAEEQTAICSGPCIANRDKPDKAGVLSGASQLASPPCRR